MSWMNSKRIKGLLAVMVLSLGFCYAAGDAVGKWELKSEGFGGQPVYYIVDISKDSDGLLKGAWGSNNDELSDVSCKEGELRFVRSRQFGDREFKTVFEGKIEGDKMNGVLVTDRGEREVAGKRVTKMECPLGDWDFTMQWGERTVESTLAMTLEDGKIVGLWKSDRGEGPIEEVEFDGKNLSFVRVIKFNRDGEDREFRISFKGVIEGNTLKGAFSSERGDMDVEATKEASAAVGSWVLTTEGQNGSRNQMLRIFGDMKNGRYEMWDGEVPVDTIKVDGNKVSLTIEFGRGDRAFTMEVNGEISGDTMKGKVVTSRGEREFTGKKMAMAKASSAVGTWEFTRETQRGTFTSTLKVADSENATFSFRNNDVPVSELKIDGDTISFVIVRPGRNGGEEFRMEYNGTIDGDTITLTTTTRRGEREMTGKRVD